MDVYDNAINQCHLLARLMLYTRLAVCIAKLCTVYHTAGRVTIVRVLSVHTASRGIQQRSLAIHTATITFNSEHSQMSQSCNPCSQLLYALLLDYRKI